MSNKKSGRDTAMLMLEILKCIPKVGTTNGPKIQEILRNKGLLRELRTIQRQLNELCEHFPDIEQDTSSKPYQYKWKPMAAGFSVPSLTPQESLLLTLAKEHLHNLLPPKLLASMSLLFDRSEDNLRPHTKAEKEREWLKKTRVVSETQPLLPPDIPKEVLEEVSNALYADQWLEIEYRNARDKRTRADVMPLGIAQQGSRLYLVCRFRGYDNERSLAMHRILSAKAGLPFERPKEFDLEKYDDDGRFGMGDGRKIKLSFRIRRRDGQHLLESKLSEDQKVEELEDDYEITATVVDSMFLDRWLLGFGDRVSGVNKILLVDQQSPPM